MNTKEEMTEFHPLNKLREIAQRVGKELEKDENNLSLIIFGSVATGKTLRKPDLDLLLVTRNAPAKMEPKNVEERIIDGEIVQISSITPDQLEKDVVEFVDYRINQMRRGKILFDKEGLVQKIKKEVKEKKAPTSETLAIWFCDLEEDRETLSQKLDDKTELLFLTNRSALWALRIFLSCKGDPFCGPKYLEEHLEHRPEIKKLFLNAFGSNFINLEAKSNLRNIIPSEEKTIYLHMVRDMLTDSDELEEKGRTIAAKTALLEALTYFGLYLQEKEQLSGWKELIEKSHSFTKLIEQIFGKADPRKLLQDYLELNRAVINLVQQQP